MSKETKTDRIGMRVSPDQKAKWEKAAALGGYNSLAAWISSVLEEKIGKSSHSN